MRNIFPKSTVCDSSKFDKSSPCSDHDEKISVIVTNRKSKFSSTKIVLQSLRNQTVPPDEIIFIEDDEHPYVEKLVKPLVDKYIFLKNDWIFNKSWCINVGVNEARNNLIISHDNDLVCENDFIERVLCEYKDHHNPRMMICWNIIVDIHKEAATFFKNKQYNYTYPTRYQKERESRYPLQPTAPAGSILFDKDFYYSIGGHDEKLIGWGAEDASFFMSCDVMGVVHFNNSIDKIKLYHLHHPCRGSGDEVYEYYTGPYLEFLRTMNPSTILKFIKDRRTRQIGDKLCPLGDVDEYNAFQNVVKDVVKAGAFRVNNITGDIVAPTDGQMIQFKKDIEKGDGVKTHEWDR